MHKATSRPPQTCRQLSGSCLPGFYEGGPLEREWKKGLRPRAYARSGLRSGPRGGCAPATCSRVKIFPKRRKHAAEDVGKLEAVAWWLPYRNLKIRKEALRRSFAPPSGSSFDYKMLKDHSGSIWEGAWASSSNRRPFPMP